MKRFNFLLAAAVMVCGSVWSCSRDNGPVYPESESEEIQLTAEEAVALHCSLNGAAISKADIMDQAADIAAYLDAGEGGIATKSGSRKIASLTPVTGVTSVTKSGAEEDTLAYIVSFGEDLGYAVLSADVRTDPVIAICPEGDLADNEESGAPNAEAFSEAMKYVIAEQIEKAQTVQDSLLAVALAKIEQTMGDSSGAETKAIRESEGIRTEYSYSDWSNAWQKGPLVKVTWGQKEPYNNNTPVKKGIHCPAGCVAVAVAQIMSYWKSPAGYDWPALTENPEPSTDKVKTEVARLMIDVGYGVKTDYKAKESGATASNARKCYSDCGYEVGTFQRYDFEMVKSCINDNIPVQTFGYGDCLLKSDFLYWFFPSEGHSWVIDGLLCQQRTITISTYGKTSNRRSEDAWTQTHRRSTENKYLLHCNWGWSGLQNGWYADGVFDILKGPEIPDPYIKQKKDYPNIQYGVKCIYDIHP